MRTLQGTHIFRSMYTRYLFLKKKNQDITHKMYLDIHHPPYRSRVLYTVGWSGLCRWSNTKTNHHYHWTSSSWTYVFALERSNLLLVLFFLNL